MRYPVMQLMLNRHLDLSEFEIKKAISFAFAATSDFSETVAKVYGAAHTERLMTSDKKALEALTYLIEATEARFKILKRERVTTKDIAAIKMMKRQSLSNMIYKRGITADEYIAEQLKGKITVDRVDANIKIMRNIKHNRI